MGVRKDPPGLTLVEVLLALTVLAIGSLVALSVLFNTSKTNETRKETAVAVKASQEITEALLTMSYDEMLAQNGVSFDVTALPGATEAGSIEIQPLSDTLAEVQVRVDHRNTHTRIVTRRAR